MTTETLPLDPTGVAVSNKIENETPALVGSANQRVFIPVHVPYFVDSMVITDTRTGKPLTSNQWMPVELAELPSSRYNARLCYGCLIKDSGVTAVKCTYQALGDNYPIQADAFLSQFLTIQASNRPDAWPSVFRDARSIDLSQLQYEKPNGNYGFEPLTESFYSLADIIENGNAPAHDALWTYAKKSMVNVSNAPDAMQLSLNSHLANYANPHKVTTSQVGIYDKPGFTAKYQPVSAAVTTHSADTNNPHKETAGGLNIYTKDEINPIVQSPITSLNTSITSHVTNTKNPHHETATSIGAYTKAQLDGIFSKLNDSLGTHPQDTNNPHNDTPDNVGTYSKNAFGSNWGAHVRDTLNPHKDSADALWMYTKPEFDELLSNLADASTAVSISGFNAAWDQRLTQRMTFVYIVPNPKIALTIAADTANYNAYNAAKDAGWDGIAAIDLTVTINGLVWVYSTDPSVPAFTTGTGWPAGSTITIINNGYIAGAGGRGADGETMTTVYSAGGGLWGKTGTTVLNVQPGQAGGAAMDLRWSVMFANNGYVLGGGGGGGGGGMGLYTYHDSSDKYTSSKIAGAGGGGGGQGYNGGAGGAGSNYYTNGTYYAGRPGATGTKNNAGSGGIGCSISLGYSIASSGGAGGAGGGWATNGATGAASHNNYADGTTGSNPGGLGGAGGAAVVKNGYSIAWSGTNGSNSAYVKGNIV